MAEIFSIYMHTNIISGKSYIGYTKKSVEERFRHHMELARHKKHRSYFQRALLKHGIRGFESTTLKMVKTLEEALYWEKIYIFALRTKYPGGYNLTDGGEGVKGLRFPSEVRAKMSMLAKRRLQNPELMLQGA